MATKSLNLLIIWFAENLFLLKRRRQMKINFNRSPPRCSPGRHLSFFASSVLSIVYVREKKTILLVFDPDAQSLWKESIRVFSFGLFFLHGSTKSNLLQNELNEMRKSHRLWQMTKSPETWKMNIRAKKVFET